MAFLKGLNHITFSVRDVERALDFYCRVLGFDFHVKWDGGAYVAIGDCWVCLSLDSSASPSDDYSHVAFSLNGNDLPAFSELLREEGVGIWKQNASEGDSVYFLDPDGNRLEAHVGDLRSRLRSIQASPYKGQRNVR